MKVSHVAIRGIAACVPSKVEENIDLPFYKEGEAEQVIAGTGIERRHIVSEGETASDLCYKAAEKLIADLEWEKDSIDMIGYVTQNPDYINQPTSFLMHDRLGLSKDCMCMDFFHGCPGWVVGMSGATSVISSNNGLIKRVLLLDGDMLSHDISKIDRESRPLFGDCGIATALEYDETAKDMYFSIGTKSADGKALIKEQGGYRHPYTMESLKFELDRREGIITQDQVTDKMDSMDVFSFAISSVPKSIKQLCAQFEIDKDSVDKIVLHQANKFMLQTIAKKLKVDGEKVVYGMKNYGNTSSTSIPLAIVSECGDEYSSKHMKTLACGFGTGLAYGTIYFESDNIVCPKVIINE